MRSRQDLSGPPVAVGIDLGTRNSRVATWQDGDVVVIPNERGRLSTPAVVAFTPAGVLVGEAAEEQADGNLENTIFGPTRLIGAKFESPWVQWYRSTCPSRIVRGPGDRPLLRVDDRGSERWLLPEEVVTLLVEHLRRTAERYLGTRVAEAVVTMPAQFGPQQCAALRQAVQAARLTVLDLVKAPTAAGIAFYQMNPLSCKQTLLVCDMGGSYFDFALLNIKEDLITERAVGTDYVDLDSTLLRFAQRDLKERFSVDVSHSQVAVHRLRMACEDARRKLAQFHQAWIEVKDIVPGTDYASGISRSHFEDCCQMEVEHLLDPIDWCLEDCGLTRADVEVVMVGGNARVPQVRRLVRAFFYGRAPHEVLRPDHAAVLGAAVYVALLSEHTLGGSHALANSNAAPAPEEDAAQGELAAPRPLQLRQVVTDRVDEPAPEDGSPTGSESGIGGWPSRHSDDLEAPPCNEATRCSRPVAVHALRPASALRFTVPRVPKIPQLPLPMLQKPSRRNSEDDVVACDLSGPPWL